MRNWKKLLAAACAGVVCAASVPLGGLTANATDEPPYTAWLCGQMGTTDSTWDAEDDGQIPATIDGDGDYSASYTIQGNGSEEIECLILYTDINSYAYAPDGASAGTNGIAEGCTVDLDVTSITVTYEDGTVIDIPYSGPSDGAYCVGDDGESLRVNIYNVWISPKVSDIDSTVDGGLITGDTLTINFTVSGMDSSTDEDDAPFSYEDDIEADVEYNLSITSSAYQYYRFIPEEDGTYDFYTVYDTNSLDTYGALYDSTGSLITSDDDSGDGYNFKISADLTAGETYYLGIRGYNSNTGTTYLYVEKEASSDSDTPTITMDTVEISLSELVATGGVVAVDAYSNVDFDKISFGGTWDDELSICGNSNSAAAFSTSDTMFWFAWFPSDTQSAGVIDTFIFEVPLEAGTYYVTPQVETATGSVDGILNDDVPTVVGGSITVIDDGTDVSNISSTPTLTMDTVEISLEELEENDCLVSVDLYTNVHYQLISVGGTWDDGLTYSNKSNSSSIFTVGDSMFWYIYSKTSIQYAGVVDTFTFEVTPEVGTYNIYLQVENSSGDVAACIDDDVPTVVSGAIIVTDDAPFSYEDDIEVDVEYNLSITSSAYQYYRFIPEETGTYDFYTVYDTDSLDTYGALYDSTGSLIISDDDSGDGNNFMITADLTAGETYYLGVRGFGGNTGTTYLYVEKEASSDSDVPVATGTPTITMDTVEISLDELEENDYLVSVDVSTNVDYQTVGFGAWLDDGLTLTDWSNSATYIATNGQFMWLTYSSARSSSAGVFDTLTFEVTPEVGTYNIALQVETYSGTVAGDVDGVVPTVISGAIIVTDESSDVPTATPVTELQPGSDMSSAPQIYEGEGYQFEAEGGSTNEKYFCFIPEETATYTFYTVSDIDTYGKLYDADGTLITSNDDGGDGNNFQIVTTLTAGETYYIGARGYDANNTGTVILFVEKYEAFSYEYDLALDVEYNLSLTGNTYKYYRFIPEETGLYKFYTTYGTSSLDTYGILYDSYGNSITSNDDGGDGNNFQIITTLTADEIYYIGVRCYSSSASGKTNLFVSQMSSPYDYEILDDGTAQITAYYGSDTALEIPSEIDGYTVTSIGNYAFEYADFTSVIIPETVTSIGSGTFYGCYNLTEITIPNSVTEIGNYAFECCYNLTAITLSENLTSIGYDAFYDCESLTSITLPDSLTSIGYGAFGWCTNLTEITIPAGVTSIGDRVFDGCSNLESITVDADNANYSSLDGVLFNKAQTELICYPANKSDSSYTVPDSVTTMDEYAFSWCQNLNTVTLPDDITEIGAYTFAFCYSLTSLSIPDSVTNIGDSAFYNCYNLTAITLSENLTDIGESAFCECESLTSITLPNSLTNIEDYTFAWCTSLTEITIPDSVTSIDSYAFLDCDSLTEITLPASVTSLGNGAFGYCSALEAITILNPDCEIETSSYEVGYTISNEYNYYEEDEDGYWIYYYYFNGTIYGYDDSTAQTYAETNGYTFESLGEVPEVTTTETEVTTATTTTTMTETTTDPITTTSEETTDSTTTSTTATTSTTIPYTEETTNTTAGPTTTETEGTTDTTFNTTTSTTTTETDETTNDTSNTATNTTAGPTTTETEGTTEEPIDTTTVSTTTEEKEATDASADSSETETETNTTAGPTTTETDATTSTTAETDSDTTTDSTTTESASVITLSTPSLGYCYVGSIFQLDYTIDPDYTGTIAWFSSDTSVATVSQEGEVSIVGEGDVTILVMDENGNSTSIRFSTFVLGSTTTSTTDDDSSTTTDEESNTTTTTTDEDSSTTTSTIPLGDLDENDAITLNDAYLALLAYANKQVGLASGLTEAQEAAADIDNDGNITINDAYLILLYYAQNQVGLNPTWEELLYG